MKKKMRYTYPISLTRTDEGFLVYVPDFNCNTQGKDEAEAMAMARDVIDLMGVDYQDDGKPLPNPSNLSEIDGDIKTYISVDFQ